jgi:hypothetical protein
MKQFTFDELSQMDNDKLTKLESAKLDELATAQRERLQRVGKILWLQDAIQKAKI